MWGSTINSEEKDIFHIKDRIVLSSSSKFELGSELESIASVVREYCKDEIDANQRTYFQRLKIVLALSIEYSMVVFIKENCR